jgi:hypothetical protein
MDKEGNKTGGRQKGTPNKMTIEVKTVVNKILQYINEDDKLQAILDDIKINKPEVYVNFVAKLAPKDLNVRTEPIDNELLQSLRDLRNKDNTSTSK